MPAADIRTCLRARSQFTRAQASQRSSACISTSKKRNQLLTLLRRVLLDVSMEVGRDEMSLHPVLSIKGLQGELLTRLWIQ